MGNIKLNKAYLLPNIPGNVYYSQDHCKGEQDQQRNYVVIFSVYTYK